MTDPAKERFMGLLRSAALAGSLVKLTLGRYRGGDPSLRNLFVRPVVLKAGPRLAFVWRHATQDIAKNHPAEEALGLIEALLGGDFLDAHLFTAAETAQFASEPGKPSRIRVTAPPPGDGGPSAGPPASGHDRIRRHPIDPGAGWLRRLGVTDERGRPRADMSAKFRQIEKFAELLGPLAADAGLGGGQPASVWDMGCGKGYLTFAVASVLGPQATVRGVESRPELVELCNRVAREEGLSPRLSFEAGTIEEARIDRADCLIALHACDTATDDALARGIAGGARLLVVAPCCQKELRPQLEAPPVLAAALRHGIFQERHAEFVTDALRALLLEWSGYRTRVFEFVSTEHTAKNVMIAAIKARERDESLAGRVRDFARFYGIRGQSLARQLGFPL